MYSSHYLVRKGFFRCRLKPVFSITQHRNIGNKGRRHNE
ncbi:Hypothetical protein NGK_1175 [Neisseria gonorrhoeae NCCP11945]|uniref:Uncharacterized protein n=1 Tax=Neisseria gonorrhoeae (strain NCCP11945) TaxID=521006 RepID=B4RM15_NEIG2|nr:Hypothetical protein NGK_1175 [Neisseria gonorrhoeae NCCP11945]